ncbi:MAG TPA: magnesium transporter [Gemmatimonadales bacterium]|jgi:magnesium transporter|nr:magnesium transporter [Gemmatimonadales bacterium]
MAKKKELTYLDVAEVWPRLTAADRARRLKQLPPEAAHEFFFDLSAADQAEVLLILAPGERRLWIRLLAPDDVADVIQAAPQDQRSALLGLLDEATRAEVTALLAYAEDEAGGLMNPRYIRVRPHMTAAEALGYFRRQAQERSGHDTPTEAYVLDGEGKLLGQVALTDLIAADAASSVARLMHTDIVTIPEEADQEEVAHRFAEHGLVAAPVVDAAGRMKGVVTADDIVAVVEEEATEDIQKLGGSEALDAPYLKTAFSRMVRKRAGWLAALFLGEMLTATAMAFFEEEIARAVVLALFVPLIISSGGNSGSQASTLVIRAMALGEVRLRDWWRVVRREIGAGVVLGLVLGTIGFLRIVLWHAITAIYGEHYLLVALTVFGSLIGVVTFGTVAGSTLPFVLRRAGFDPASASAPFVATLVDVTGLVIYFTMASLILRGTLL